MAEDVTKIHYEIKADGGPEALGSLEDVHAAAAALQDQLAALKEEPLALAPEGELPKPPGKKKKEEDKGDKQAAK